MAFEVTWSEKGSVPATIATCFLDNINQPIHFKVTGDVNDLEVDFQLVEQTSLSSQEDSKEDMLTKSDIFINFGPQCPLGEEKIIYLKMVNLSAIPTSFKASVKTLSPARLPTQPKFSKPGTYVRTRCVCVRRLFNLYINMYVCTVHSYVILCTRGLPFIYLLYSFLSSIAFSNKRIFHKEEVSAIMPDSVLYRYVPSQSQYTPHDQQCVYRLLPLTGSFSSSYVHTYICTVGVSTYVLTYMYIRTYVYRIILCIFL